MKTTRLLCCLGYILLAPFIGGLLDGMDRKLSARMQGRTGPSVLQPFYDIIKLFHKQIFLVNHSQFFLVGSYLVFVILVCFNYSIVDYTFWILLFNKKW